MNGIHELNDEQILNGLKQTAAELDMKHKSNYWMSDEGQSELLRRYDLRRPPTGLLAPMDYTAESKAMLLTAGAAGIKGGGDEWIEIEFTADTGACDTVIPKTMAGVNLESIPIVDSLQSLRHMEYEVATGASIPNLGERRCIMWTEHAAEARHLNMQVADIHKPLLSLSRCADMGFESRFGRVAGALIDEQSGEVIPLQRKGNLYVLKCWIKAAPFGRPDKS